MLLHRGHGHWEVSTAQKPQPWRLQIDQSGFNTCIAVYIYIYVHIVFVKSRLHTRHQDEGDLSV